MPNIDSADSIGRTALHYAALRGNTNILKILIASGCDVNSRTISGETALVKTIQFNRIENARLLMRYGLDPNIPSNVISYYIRPMYCRSSLRGRKGRRNLLI